MRNKLSLVLFLIAFATVSVEAQMPTQTADILIKNAKILNLGITFKENCPDVRNTKVADMVACLQAYKALVDVYDPWVVAEEALNEYEITPISQLKSGSYDAIVLAVAHQEFEDMDSAEIRALGKPRSVIYDLKYVLTAEQSNLRL